MLKKTCCLLSLIISLPITLCALPKNAVVCYKGKSSGEFSEISKIQPVNLINRNGFSYECSFLEAELLVKKLKAKKVHSFSADGVDNYYYYSSLLPTKEVVFKKRVNIHIAVTRQKTTVGSPIIYYGY